MLSQLFVFRESKNFTSDHGIQMPPTAPVNHYDGSRNQQNRTVRPILLFHANIFERNACFEHSNFLTVKGPTLPTTQLSAAGRPGKKPPLRPVRTVRWTGQ